MLIYIFFDTIVVFGWSAFVLVFRDLVIQYSIIPQTYSIDSFLEKNRQIVHTVWSVKDGAAETQREPGFMAGFWQSQSCPNLIFCFKLTKAGSQWVSDTRRGSNKRVDWNLSKFNKRVSRL